MMRLRAIGGPRDGQWVNIREDMPHIKLIDPDHHRMEGQSNVQVLAMNTVSYTVYTRREVRDATGWNMRFLAPEHWSDAKAIEHQFKK